VGFGDGVKVRVATGERVGPGVGVSDGVGEGPGVSVGVGVGVGVQVAGRVGLGVSVIAGAFDARSASRGPNGLTRKMTAKMKLASPLNPSSSDAS